MIQVCKPKIDDEIGCDQNDAKGFLGDIWMIRHPLAIRCLDVLFQDQLKFAQQELQKVQKTQAAWNWDRASHVVIWDQLIAS